MNATDTSHARPIAAAAETTDDALVSGVRAGDPRAFELIHARYRRPLERYAARMLDGHRSVAEDVVQESLWRAHQALVADDRPITLRPWLYRIVRNRSLDELRGAPSPRSMDDLSAVAAPDDPHAAAVLHERLNEVVADIVSLPALQREALVGHVLDGAPYHTVAAQMDLSITASKALVRRAQDSLRRTRRARSRAHASAPLAA
jgi:RNA polymerase sigma factor (sigma-70 family)